MRRAACVLGLATVAMASACDKLGGTKEAPASSAAATAAPAAATAAVTRYGTSETAESGTLSIRQAVAARKAADTVSATVFMLQPGSAVTRVAHYGGYTLVSWTVPTGTEMGWVDTALATRSTVVLLDAGVPTTTNVAPAFSNAGFGPSGSAKPVPTTPPATTPVPTNRANPFGRP
jgi:hypothetical protein